MFSFKTEVNGQDFNIESHIYGKVLIPDIKINVPDFSVMIEWEIEPDMRKWGVSDFVISVKKISALIYWSIDGPTKQKNKSGSIHVETNGEQFWEIEKEFGFKEDGSIAPRLCEINFKDRKISIS